MVQMTMMFQSKDSKVYKTEEEANAAGEVFTKTQKVLARNAFKNHLKLKHPELQVDHEILMNVLEEEVGKLLILIAEGFDYGENILENTVQELLHDR